MGIPTKIFFLLSQWKNWHQNITYPDYNLKDDIHNNLFINLYQMDDTNWML